MRIGMISTIFQRVPPKTYGAVERLVHDLCEELIAMGHDVTLFASGDSITSARLVSAAPVHLDEAKVPHLRGSMYIQLNGGLAFDMQGEFDIIHVHDGFFSLPAANISRTPVVVTVHSAFHENNRTIFEKLRNPYLISISKSHGTFFEGLNHLGTVYNGLRMEHYPFSDTHEGYMLYVGRISRVKGVHRAVHVAKRTGVPLIIAAKNEEQDYFDEEIRPYLDDNIKWIGEVSEEERNRLMSKAMCFIHPITWHEPFGLTLIESMSCGCPVVAIGKGSIPEIIEHGRTGFVATDEDGLARGVMAAGGLDRSYCRKYSLSRFSARTMAKGYIEKYSEAIAARSSGKAYPAQERGSSVVSGTGKKQASA